MTPIEEKKAHWPSLKEMFIFILYVRLNSLLFIVKVAQLI